MHTKKAPALIALLLALCLLMAGCLRQQDSASSGASSAVNGGNTPNGTVRRLVPFSEMHYTRPDVPVLVANIEELATNLAEADTFEEAQQVADEFERLLEDYSTQYWLADLHRVQNVNDSFFRDETAYLASADVDVTLAAQAFNRELTEGAFSEDFRHKMGDYAFEMLQMALLFTSESVKELQRQRDELADLYQTQITSLAVTYEGKDYTYFDIFDVDSLGLYYHLSQLYYNQHLDQFADMYAQMVALDKEIAYTLGFEDAPTMYYLRYGRDYGPKKAQTMFNEIKTSFVPVFEDLPYHSGWPEATLEDAFSGMETATRLLGNDFHAAWSDLVQYGLSDCEYRPEKRQGVAFTTHLSRYDAPFIYSCWDDSAYSANTLVHEFGHFYDAWLHYDTDIASNLDLAETYSQSLELLMLPQHDLFTPSPAESRYQTLLSMGEGALIWQSVLEEFQLRVYALETFDGVILGRTFSEVMQDYGFQPDSHMDSSGADNSWICYATLFDTPFYTVSYVTSAATALQLWGQSRSDWEGAVERYQSMIHSDQNRPYSEILHSAGLQAAHEEGVIGSLASLYADSFAETESQKAGVQASLQENTDADSDADSLPDAA